LSVIIVTSFIIHLLIGSCSFGIGFRIQDSKIIVRIVREGELVSGLDSPAEPFKARQSLALPVTTCLALDSGFKIIVRVVREGEKLSAEL